MKSSTRLIGAMMMLLLSMSACKHELYNGNGQDPALSFADDVLPIFQSNCAKSGCHDVATASEGYVLNSYENIMKKGIKPFKPDDSKIYEMIIKSDVFERMPQFPNPPLPAEQINAIRTWILQGALNN